MLLNKRIWGLGAVCGCIVFPATVAGAIIIAPDPGSDDGVFVALIAMIGLAAFVWVWMLWIFIFCAWWFSLKVATTLAAAVMSARAEQASTLAATAQKPPKTHTIFGSMRFPVPDEARRLQAELENAGVTLHIVEMQAGQDITDLSLIHI